MSLATTATDHHALARRTATALGWFFAGAGVMRRLPVPFDAALGHSLLVAIGVNGGLAATAFATAWTPRAEVDGIGGGR